MKIIQLFLSVLLFSIVCGCNNDDNGVASICFEKEYYERPLSENFQEIEFSGGSGNLLIEVSDNDVLEAAIGDGNIKIKTKKKGVVYLVVKDEEDNTSVTIRVKVIDSYLSVRLGSPIPTNSAYEKNDCLFLVNNTSHTFYLYDESYNLKRVGGYNLYREDSKFFLSLVFPETVRLYDISNSSYAFLFGAIPTILDFSWKNEYEVTTNSRSVSPVSMNAIDSDTGDIYYFYVDSTEIPYGVLN
jgi:hypothetical protein